MVGMRVAIVSRFRLSAHTREPVDQAGCTDPLEPYTAPICPGSTASNRLVLHLESTGYLIH